MHEKKQLKKSNGKKKPLDAYQRGFRYLAQKTGLMVHDSGGGILIFVETLPHYEMIARFDVFNEKILGYEIGKEMKDKEYTMVKRETLLPPSTLQEQIDFLKKGLKELKKLEKEIEIKKTKK